MNAEYIEPRTRRRGAERRLAPRHASRRPHRTPLVDATGRHATIARRLGAEKIVDDHLVGIAGVFEPHAAIERAYPLIEARREGWIYSAILPDERLVVVAR